jgi:hypothetical protein
LVPTKKTFGSSAFQAQLHISDSQLYLWISAHELMLVSLAVLSWETDSSWS